LTVALAKRERIAQQKKTDKAQRKFSAQQKSNLIFVTDSAGASDTLERSHITDTVDPTSTITESLACFYEFTAPADKFDYSTIQPSSPRPLLGRDHFCHLGTESLRYQSHLNEGRKCTLSPHTGANMPS